jgi:hypothetical protein
MTSNIHGTTSNISRDHDNMKLCFVMSSTHRTKYEMEMRRQVLDKTPPGEFFVHCRMQNWHEFAKVCRENPENCTWISPYGHNLLHFMCQRRPSVESICTVLRIVPDALMKEDIDGCLPIHMAMTNGASHDVLSLLIQIAPESITVKNKWGYAPYEWIFERSLYELLNPTNSLDPVVKDIIWHTIEILMKTLSKNDKEDGRTILHMATEFNCPMTVIEAILNEFPWMTIAHDVHGRVPLASAAGAPLNIVSNQFIQLLILVRPEVLIKKDNEGRTPLHIAIDMDRDWSSVLKFMVQSFPDCILIQDGLTNLFPFMLMSSRESASLNDVKEAMSICVDVFNEMC